MKKVKTNPMDVLEGFRDTIGRLHKATVEKRMAESRIRRADEQIACIRTELGQGAGMENVVKEFEDAGFSKFRSETLAIGMYSGLSVEELKFIASDDLDDSLAASIEEIFDRGNVPYDEVVRIAGLRKTLGESSLFAITALRCYEAVGKEYCDMLLSRKDLSVTKLGTIASSLDWKYGVPKDLMEFTDMPLSDNQFAAVFYADPNRCFKSGRTRFFLRDFRLYELACGGTDAGKALMSDQLRIIARPELSAELIAILRLGLLAGLPVEQVGEYARPDVSPEEALEELLKAYCDRPPVTPVAPI